MKNFAERACKYGYFSLLTFLSLFVIILVPYLSSNVNFLFGDDGTFSLYRTLNESFFDCLKFVNHGEGFIGLFLTKFFCFGLPNMLGLHPSDFIGPYSGFVRGLLTVAILMTIAYWGCFYKKSKTLFLFLYVVLIAFFFWSAPQCMMLMCNFNFYRYFLPMIFLVLFWNFLLKNLLAKRKKINFFYLAVACFSGYVTATSVEITIFSTLMCITLIILYSIFVNVFIKNDKLKKSLKLNLDINFWLPILFFCVFIILFTTSQGFKEIACDSRGLGRIAVDFDMVKEFMKVFFDLYIVKKLFYVLSFVVLFTMSAFIAVRKNKIKKIIFPFFYVISLYSVIFSLIFLGKTHYFGDFWITHSNIIFLYDLLLIFITLYCLSFVLQNPIIKNIKVRRTIIAILAGIMFFQSFICCKEGISDSKDQNNYLYAYKKSMYISEKMLRFYCLKDEIAILPKKLFMSLRYEVWTFEATQKENDYYINSVITDSYYKRIYHDTTHKYIGFVLRDDAVEQFYKNGGSFSKEELENVQFSRLFDENFVLNKNYSAEEMKDIVNDEIIVSQQKSP